MTAPNADDFWSFSLRFYSDHAVEDSCLALQDGCGADVNIVLLAFYAASCCTRLTTLPSSHTNTISQEWRENVIAPIRQSRRAFKNSILGVRAQSLRPFKLSLQVMELEAEKIGQRLLMEDTQFQPTDILVADLAALNVEIYEATFALQLDRYHVNRLLEAFAAYQTANDPSATRE